MEIALVNDQEMWALCSNRYSNGHPLGGCFGAQSSLKILISRGGKTFKFLQTWFTETFAVGSQKHLQETCTFGGKNSYFPTKLSHPSIDFQCFGSPYLLPDRSIISTNHSRWCSKTLQFPPQKKKIYIYIPIPHSTKELIQIPWHHSNTQWVFVHHCPPIRVIKVIKAKIHWQNCPSPSHPSHPQPGNLPGIIKKLGDCPRPRHLDITVFRRSTRWVCRWVRRTASASSGWMEPSMAPAHEPVKLTQKLGDWTNKKKKIRWFI